MNGSLLWFHWLLIVFGGIALIAGAVYARDVYDFMKDCVSDRRRARIVFPHGSFQDYGSPSVQWQRDALRPLAPSNEMIHEGAVILHASNLGDGNIMPCERELAERIWRAMWLATFTTSRTEEHSP